MEMKTRTIALITVVVLLLAVSLIVYPFLREDASQPHSGEIKGHTEEAR